MSAPGDHVRGYIKHLIEAKASGVGVVRVTQRFTLHDISIERPASGWLPITLDCAGCGRQLSLRVSDKTIAARIPTILNIVGAFLIAIFVLALGYAIGEGGKEHVEGTALPVLLVMSFIAVPVTFVAAGTLIVTARRSIGVRKRGNWAWHDFLPDPPRAERLR